MDFSRRSPERRCPVDRLPIELLSYIFILSTHRCHVPFPAENRQKSSFDSESVTAPLAILSVSRQWRHVALSTSSLWTSICVTSDFIDVQGAESSSASINTAPLVTYLARSRNAPIDIMIDARDPSWDFSESGVTPTSTSYVPPFQPTHMEQTMHLLLPHLSRWRTVTILTDTWQIMHTALAVMNPSLLAQGAPQLQSLVLVRCNDFISHGSDFQPHHLKDSPFLATAPASATESAAAGVFPRLRHLVMQGVHGHWAALPSALQARCLETLELSSHSLQVRPTVDEFCNILSSCQSLRKLVIDGSGVSDFLLDDEGYESDGDANAFHRHAAHRRRAGLPMLEEIDLGYRSAEDACRLLDLLDAPNVKTLTLRNAAHPASPEVNDASQLLLFIGTGCLKHPKIRELRTFSSHPSYAPFTAIDSVDIAPSPSLPFPALGRITLDKVVSTESHFRAFFAGLSGVTNLTINPACPPITSALIPTSSQNAAQCSGSASSSPCPRLQHLVLHVADANAFADLSLASHNGLLLSRVAMGLPAPHQVEVLLETRDKRFGLGDGPQRVDVRIGETLVTIVQPDEDEAEADCLSDSESELGDGEDIDVDVDDWPGVAMNATFPSVGPAPPFTPPSFAGSKFERGMVH
ncbi:hypothetical protein HGRIS_014337 [Hohenbuehelia grisea]|uniref:F-box domain-containing protein n=1 Tax=Hohenbuehelia grisea TaxID=104357 RepID=A0ABR3JT30_9AGAR